MKRAFTVYNESGGTGKTVTAVNAAAALSRTDADVLAIDLDPQPGSLTDHVTEGGRTITPHGDKNNIAHALREPDAVAISDIILDVGDFDIIPSHEALSDVERALHAAIDVRMEEFQLQTVLQPVYSAYDYIVIDPQPSMSLLVDNALVASRNVIIPIELNRKGHVSFRGLQRTIESMEAGFQQFQSDFSVNVLGVVPNNVRDANIAADTRERLEQEGVPVTPFDIRQRTALQYAWQANQSVFEYAEENGLREYEQDVLVAYEKLAEIVRKGGVEVNADEGEQQTVTAHP